MAKKILVVEDEATQILLLQSRLRAHGFDVVCAMNGEEGVRKAYAERPDLILLDVVLPRMTGIEVCGRLKDAEETRAIPIVLVTASGMQDLEERCKALGADGCLVKPYQPSELLEKIHAILPDPAAVATAPPAPPLA